jgi:hypothetical protein
MDTFFGIFFAKISTILDHEQQFEISIFTQVMAPYHVENIVDSCERNQIWSLYFDGSKSGEGEGVSCLLIYPKVNKMLISCILEFDYTNNKEK